MKKGNRITVSKNAWNLAKNYAHSNQLNHSSTTAGGVNNTIGGLSTTPGGGGVGNTIEEYGDLLTLAKQNSLEDSILQKLEDEVMGEVSKTNNNKSDVMERNLTQMIDVLHLRLKALETAAKVRLEYCLEDQNPNSTKESKMAPRIMEEFEDQRVNPRVLLKDLKMSTNTSQVKEMNLVSMEGVSIDPYKLVIKTKPGTDAAKKLETKLEEKYSSSRMEMKGKKNKTARQVARSKESQTKRYESKKTQRQKLEKELTANMESYVTRSVNDSDLDFILPISQSGGEGEGREELEVVWPISIKWIFREQKSSSHPSLVTGNGGGGGTVTTPSHPNHSSHGGGGTSPAPLSAGGNGPPTTSSMTSGGPGGVGSSSLTINSSSNPENFEGEMCPELLLLYSLERINLPSGERIFKKLFRNLILQKYFVYMFWFIKVLFFQSPSSHTSAAAAPSKAQPKSQPTQQQTTTALTPPLPTKALGVISSSTSSSTFSSPITSPTLTAEKYLLSKLGTEYVKIVELLSWATHGENNKDFIFKYLPYLLTNAIYYSFYFLCPGSRHLYSKGLRKTILLQIVQVMHGVQLCPISVKVTWNKLFPEDIQDDEDGEENEMIPLLVPVHGKKVSNNTSSGNNNNENGSGGGPNGGGAGGGSKPLSPNHLKKKTQLTLSHSLGSGGGPNGSSRPQQFSSYDEDDPSDDQHSLLSHSSVNLNSVRLNDELSRNHHPGSGGIDSSPRHSHHRQHTNSNGELETFHILVDPIDRVNLKPPLPKSRYIVPRQKREKCDINDISPLMQQYLELPTASGGKPSQNLLRTLPINWCVAGGSDTHRKRYLPKELHDELSLKVKNLSPSVTRGKKTNTIEHQKKLKETKLIDRNYQNILKGGPSMVARYSQDLVRKLKHVRGLSEFETNEEKAIATLHNGNGSDEEEYSSELINSMLGMAI
jgi:hypothetical protein